MTKATCKKEKFRFTLLFERVRERLPPHHQQHDLQLSEYLSIWYIITYSLMDDDDGQKDDDNDEEFSCLITTTAFNPLLRECICGKGAASLLLSHHLFVDGEKSEKNRKY